VRRYRSAPLAQPSIVIFGEHLVPSESLQWLANGLGDEVFVVRFQAQATYFPVLHSIQTRFGNHLVSYTTNIGPLSSGIKRPKREADHSIPSSAKFDWSYHLSFIFLHSANREIFTFTILASAGPALKMCAETVNEYRHLKTLATFSRDTAVFRDMTQRSLVEMHRKFRRKILPPSSWPTLKMEAEVYCTNISPSSRENLEVAYCFPEGTQSRLFI
jgi:hypothetical protein